MIRKQTKLWTMRDGRRIRICDMEDSHLINTMRLLKRRAEQQLTCTEISMLCGPRPCGDMAQSAFEEELARLAYCDWRDFVSDLFEAMELDAQRRGLEVAL